MIGAAARPGGQAGESLLELLVAVTLLGTSAVAVLGAFGTLIKTSNAGDKVGAVAATVAAAAEAVADNARNPYDASCAALPAYDPTAGLTLPPSVAASGVTVESVRYWSGPTLGFTTSCNDATPELRLQLLTIRVMATDGETGRVVEVVKRG